jgi:hypothetical protein
MGTYYVDPTLGLDGNAGSQLAPWHDPCWAIQSCTDGDTLVMVQGTYQMATIGSAKGTDGTFPTATSFSSASVNFQTQGVQANDFLFARDPDGRDRSWKIQSVSGHTLNLAESASTSGGASIEFWCCVAGKLASRSLYGPGGSSAQGVIYDFNGSIIDANGQATVGMEAVGTKYWTMKNGTIKNATTTQLLMGSNRETTQENVVVLNMALEGGQYGLKFDPTYDANHASFLNCRAKNCTVCGFYMYLWQSFVGGCVAADCGVGFQVPCSESRHFFFDNLAHGSTNEGFKVENNSQLRAFVRNVAAKNGTYGFNFTGDPRRWLFINNILHGNTMYDLYMTANPNTLFQLSNCIGTIGGTAVRDASDIADDPCFVDPDHDDFRLRDKSPCWERGFANSFIIDNVGHIGLQDRTLMGPKVRPVAYANPTQTMVR